MGQAAGAVNDFMSSDAGWLIPPMKVGYETLGGKSTGDDVAKSMGASVGTPGVPDYKGAAEATAAGNHPSIHSDFGNVDWTTGRDASGNQTWTGDITLPDSVRQALQGQQGLQLGRTQMAQGMLGTAGADLQHGIDWQGLGKMDDGSAARDQAIQGAYSQAKSRLDPQWQQGGDSQRQMLYAQGLREGDQAFDNQMGNFGRSKNDAYSSAMNGAIAQGTAAQQATFGENLQARQQNIGEQYQQQYGGMNALNAFLNGQQVSMPSFPGSNMQGANYSAAANLQGQANLANAQMASQNMAGLMGGAGSLGAAAMFAL